MSCLTCIVHKAFFCVYAFVTGNVHLLERSDKRQGFASLFIFACKTCGNEEPVWSSSKRDLKAPFEVNERASISARLIGQGHAGLNTFAAAMDIPHPVSSNYVVKHMQAALKAAEAEVEESLQSAAKALAEKARTTDVEVSFDGAWSHRGYTAQYGFGSVISIETGKVLDYHVASKRCPQCEIWDKKDPDHKSDAWRDWKAEHDPDCFLNHAGKRTDRLQVVRKYVYVFFFKVFAQFGFSFFFFLFLLRNFMSFFSHATVF